jgi:putative PEP-CTERM system histidine kinase
MLALAAKETIDGLSANSLSADELMHWQQLRLLCEALVPGIWLLFSRTYSRSDRHKQFSWRVLLYVTVAVLPLAFAAAFWNELFVARPTLTGTGGLILYLTWPAVVVQAAALCMAVGAMMNLESTFRASVGLMRWRIKYMLLGVGLILAVGLFISSQAVLYRGVDPSVNFIDALAGILGVVLIVRSFSRAGHFELQVFPSHAVLQRSITVLVAGCYLLGVGVFAKIVHYFGGEGTSAFTALIMLLALVGLALLLQSDRIRVRMGHFVSRNFHRPLYDYRAVWKKFTDGTATRMSRPDLCRALVRLIADQFQALSVTIWIVDEHEGVVSFGASTSRSGEPTEDRQIHRVSMEAVIRYFRSHPAPVDFEEPTETWAATLRAWHPAEFAEAGHRVAVPIFSRGEVIGLITVGDRVGGVAFGLQDFDLLACVAEHAAANLLNADLSEKLLQAKELESFQKMAAFFVHDLKNTASTLNLMLKNLPLHFDDPLFREDALRGIAKTVTRINDLTGRLNTLRHELKITLGEVDLNELITQALGALRFAPEIQVERDLTPMPRTKLDRDQINKVVVNLLLNASEAMPHGGRLRVATGRNDTSVIITVADTGCGMSAEFLARSLFRPFQTTKKTGLGIGMFQCKAIIEAHGGKITVASEASQGTVFQVFLPRAA